MVRDFLGRVGAQRTAAWARFLEISKLAATGPDINNYRGSAGVEGDLCVLCRRPPELAPSPVKKSDVGGTLRAWVRGIGGPTAGHFPMRI